MTFSDQIVAARKLAKEAIELAYGALDALDGPTGDEYDDDMRDEFGGFAINLEGVASQMENVLAAAGQEASDAE